MLFRSASGLLVSTCPWPHLLLSSSTSSSSLSLSQTPPQLSPTSPLPPSLPTSTSFYTAILLPQLSFSPPPPFILSPSPPLLSSAALLTALGKLVDLVSHNDSHVVLATANTHSATFFLCCGQNDLFVEGSVREHKTSSGRLEGP